MRCVRGRQTVLDRVVVHDHTVMVIEHHLDITQHADWLIVLGPRAGSDGGHLLYQGHPANYLDAPNPTSQALTRPDQPTNANCRPTGTPRSNNSV